VVTDNVDAFTGHISNNGTTNDGRPVLGGTGEPNSIITVYDTYNAVKISLGTATVDSTGHWSFQPSTSLGQGNHTFSTTEKDEAGNISSEGATITVTVDTIAPIRRRTCSSTHKAQYFLVQPKRALQWKYGMPRTKLLGPALLT
jgi:VCBS repeat-containing protein